MGKKYNHLSLEEREQIAILRAEGKSIRKIGKIILRDHGTIVRELKRNAPPDRQGQYLPHGAAEKARLRKEVSGQRRRLKNQEIRDYVRWQLNRGWSPEQIAGRLSMEKPHLSISYEAIYQYIYQEFPALIGCLARRHRRRHERGTHRKHRKCSIPNRISITERPGEINERKEIGHWEADMVVSGKNNVSLNVLCERMSRYVHITKLKDKTAVFTRDAIQRKLQRYPESLRKSITYDNGPENTDHQFLNRVLGTQSYFCQPYHSWEKGTVENTIGLIRRFIPKATDFAPFSEKEIGWIEEKINTRPRKCLNYLTPEEVFQKLSGALPG